MTSAKVALPGRATPGLEAMHFPQSKFSLAPASKVDSLCTLRKGLAKARAAVSC